jgi:hypothetical protein
MNSWSLVPGFALIAVGYAIQFGTYLRRPRSFELVRTGVRLRLVGFGALFLGIGLDWVIRALVGGFQIGSLVFGLVMIVLGGTWVYAGSDQSFRRR